MGGKVIEHLPGPPAELEGHVQTWLHKMAKDIDHYTISKRLGFGRRPVVVLAYASKEQSPRGMDWGDVREHLLNCAGAALIFCKPAQAQQLEGRNRMVRYLGYAGLGAAIVLGFLGLIVADAAPEPLEEQGSRAATVAPEIAGGEAPAKIGDARDAGTPDAEVGKGPDGGIRDGGNTGERPQSSANVPATAKGRANGPRAKPAGGTTASVAAETTAPAASQPSGGDKDNKNSPSPSSSPVAPAASPPPSGPKPPPTPPSKQNGNK